MDKPKIEEVEKLARQIIDRFGCKHVTVLDFHYDWRDGSYRIVVESANMEDGKFVRTPDGRGIKTARKTYEDITLSLY